MRRESIPFLEKTGELTDDIWNGLPEMNIDFFPWDVNGYKPKSAVQMYFTKEYFALKFFSEEKNIRGTHLHLNEEVYEDSCMEFFLLPCLPGENRYMNFELNVFGTLLLGFGESREHRVRLDVDPRQFEIKASQHPDCIDIYDGKGWAVEFIVPFSFLEEHYGPMKFEKGQRMKANFYKCGDKTEQPHYGCWNLIELASPDYHCPEFFGELELI